MTRGKAPDNMPTELIERYIDTAKVAKAEWKRAEKDARQRCRTAVERVAYYNRHIAEYESWLEKRLEEAP